MNSQNIHPTLLCILLRIMLIEGSHMTKSFYNCEEMNIQRLTV